MKTHSKYPSVMPILVLLFIVVPIVELWAIIEVGRWIGVLPTLALLVADSILGAYLLKHEGRNAWRSFNQAVAERRIPHKEVINGVFVILGGALLLTPGFITDIFGFVLLVPPTRALVLKLTNGYVTRRAQSGRSFFYTLRGYRDNKARPRTYDADASAHDVDSAAEPKRSELER